MPTLPAPSDAAVSISRTPCPAASTPHNRNVGVVDEGPKDAHRVGAAADAGDDVAGQASVAFEHLRARLDPDHLLELAHQIRIRMRADDRTDHVERVLDPRRPLAKRFVRRVLERARPALDRIYRRAEQLHQVDVERLALDVDLAHVDVDLHPELGADRRRRDAVLSRTRLGDEPPLAHPPR